MSILSLFSGFPVWHVYLWCGIICICLGILFRVLHVSRLRRRLADNRLRILHNMIELFYLYQSQPLKFTHKFRDEIAARHLRQMGIILPPRHPVRSDAEANEQFLCRLLDAGFSRKEVCAIFGLKSINCLYVKFHRIKKKLESEKPSKEKSGQSLGTGTSIR